MSTRDLLGQKMIDEIDRTLDSLTFRALTETYVVLGVAFHVGRRAVRFIIQKGKEQ